MSTAETPKRRGRPPKVKEALAPTPPPQGEMVVPIPLTELHPFPNHPFKVRDDEAMKETTESVKEYGVLTPAYQIAALKPEEQALLVESIESEQATPSVSQAQRSQEH